VQAEGLGEEGVAGAQIGGGAAEQHGHRRGGMALHIYKIIIRIDNNK
jgi:hypothetical protein